ncbi:MAG TPA: Mov34/MPN/PAD-1 family protein, partial [Rhizomicrobium sp.]
RAAGRDIVGCYHSHPDGRAAPSPRDRAGAAEAGFVWLIAVPAAAAAVTLAAYVFDGEDFLSAKLSSPVSLDPVRAPRV